jgi:hypothetical protein
VSSEHGVPTHQTETEMKYMLLIVGDEQAMIAATPVDATGMSDD